MFLNALKAQAPLFGEGGAGFPLGGRPGFPLGGRPGLPATN
jgi:hypothetical protein